MRRPGAALDLVDLATNYVAQKAVKIDLRVKPRKTKAAQAALGLQKQQLRPIEKAKVETES